MTKTWKLGLAAVLALMFVTATYAQSPESETWTGVTYVIDEQITESPGAGLVETTYDSTYSPSTFTLTYDPSTLLISLATEGYALTGESFFGDPFTTGSASFVVTGGFDGPDIGNFFQTGPYVSAGMLLDTTIGGGTGDIINVMFATVPEPSSFVTATTGVLALSFAAWMRRRGCRKAQET